MPPEEESDRHAPSLEGPFSWENWRAFEAGEPEREAYEVPLFTDAYVTGEATEGLGPYQFFNPVHFREGDRGLRLGFVLRVGNHLPVDLAEEATRRLRRGETEDELYHGGTLPDELAALASLAIGIRMKAGGMTREFREGIDPRGRPTAWFAYGDPILPRATGTMLPKLTRKHSLAEINPVKAFPQLSAKDAIALIRAARTYQDGLWLADSDAELAWLLLVTAVECVAGHWRSSTGSPLD